MSSSMPPAKSAAQRSRPPIALPPKVQRNKKDWFSIAAFVLGIISLGSSVIVPFCNLPLPLVGIVVSILGIRSKQRKGLAFAGLAMCLLTLAIALILVLLGVAQSLSDYGTF